MRGSRSNKGPPGSKIPCLVGVKEKKERKRRGRRQESMDVEAVVSVVIRKLTDLLIQESIIFDKKTNEVELVRISLRQMQNFLIDAEDKKEHDDDVKNWVKDFLAVVYKVEDAIETFVLWRMHIRRIGVTRRHFFIHKKLKAFRDLRNEMKEINMKIKELGDNWKQILQKSRHSDPPSQTQNQPASSSYSVDEESDIIGFREAKRKLVTRLTDRYYGSLDVISIVGGVGSGKTTLAREIFNSSEIKGHFNSCAWVSASENLTDVFRSILEQTDSSTVEKESTREELVRKLRENLKTKRYLVVFDDVQTRDVLKNLRDALPKETNCSRVLLTTSNKFIARFADPMRFPYQLKPLEYEDTWNLFLKKVRFQLPDDFQFSDSNTNAHQKTLAISELKRKVITSCKGLPLAIVVLGGFLSTKSASFQEWSKVLDHPSWQLEGNEVQFSKILALSYGDLPFHLRLCLIYFGLFPKGYEIPVTRLRLWLAEGFVKQSPEREPEAEDMVERYLGELLNREMIQITSRRKDGSAERCCLLGQLHDIILSKVKDTVLFHIHENTLDHETNAFSSYQEGLTQNQQASSSYSEDEESVIIGFREAKRKLVTRLTDRYSRRRDVISIVGAVGSGKTTLAREIYNSSKIKGHFDCRAWVSAFGNLTDVFRSILEQTNNSAVDKESTLEKLEKKLRENLENKRYLVVLNDVQRRDVLLDLREALPKKTNGSRVLLTTSNPNIAGIADPIRLPYQLKPLNDEDAWNLFLKKLRLSDKADFEFSYWEILELKQIIIERCKGLPLAISLLGGLLSTKSASYEEWLKVLEHPSWELEGNEVQFSKIFALCFNDLPFHLRPCLLYFGLFPKGYEIPVTRLQRVWLAVGFVKHSPERALEELLNRQMIQVTTRRKDGNAERCCLPGHLHDIIKDTGLLRLHGNMLDHETDAFSSSVDEESGAIVFKGHNRRLVSRLIYTFYGRLKVISIVGAVGFGKTTLAREIYNNSEIKGHFNCCAWVSASENLTDVFRSILEQTNNSPVDKESTQEELVKKLRENLQNKRYLVVLDDVRTLDLLKSLHDVLPKETNDSRVLLTTSKQDVARFKDPWPHQLMPLKDEDAWNLLKKKARLPDNVFSYSEIIELKEIIRSRCKGTPLAIVVLGGLLSTKSASNEEWLKVLKHPSWQLERNEVQLSQVLALSYNDLPFHLRPCLLYFGLFPKGYEIPVRRLQRLWLAEGFVKHSPERAPEDVVEIYQKQLSDRQMIQVTKRRKDGRAKRCCIRGELHDIILSKVKDIGLFHIHGNSSDRETDASSKLAVRRVAEHGDIKDYPCEESSYVQHLRSYLSFNIQKRDTPAEAIGNFLLQVIRHRAFGMLKVLDLERVYKPKLPENLGKLYHLKYLGLRWTFLDTLPHSVGKLSYLETLDVKHTYISSLPKNIWNMKHLRHLSLNDIRLDMSVQKHRRSLTQLQMLWGLFVDKRSPVKNGLNGITNLKKLGLTYHLDSTQELNEWITRLAGLQYLRLRSKDGSGRPSKLELKPLSSLENLTDLYLLGNLQKLPEMYEFPPKLTVLTLSVSKLKTDPMPILAQLPSLSVLRLLADSYTGKEIKCPSEGFTVLRILKLWMLKELEKWTVEEGAMQNLRDLEIRSCNLLKELPEKLLNLSNIQKIILTNMPKGFANNVQADKDKKKIITKRELQCEAGDSVACAKSLEDNPGQGADS